MADSVEVASPGTHAAGAREPSPGTHAAGARDPSPGTHAAGAREPSPGTHAAPGPGRAVAASGRFSHTSKD
jgi:hypothetical protein